MNVDPKRRAQNGSAVPPELPIDKDELLSARADRESLQVPENRDLDREEDDSFHPLAILLGILMVLLLVAGAWFIFKQARCNPLYSDSGLSRSQSCR